MKIEKMNELYADYIERNLELIQDVTERLKIYPEYASELQIFNEQFPLTKEIADDNGTLRYTAPIEDDANQIKKLNLN